MAQKLGLARPVAVAEGGTGANNAEDARFWLGIGDFRTSGSDGDAFILDVSVLDDDYTYKPVLNDGYLSTIYIKSTTGDPTGKEGLFVWNSIDNTLKVFIGSAYRNITFT